MDIKQAYINGGIISALIIYRIKPDITAHIPFEGMIRFSVVNWITVQNERDIQC